MNFDLKRFNSILAVTAVSAACMAGCNSSATHKPSAADKARAGKAIQPAPPIAQRVPEEPVETPESAGSEKSPDKPAQPAEAEPIQLAAKNAPAVRAPAKPAGVQPPAAPGAAEIGQVDPLELVMPPVLMTEREAKTCQVKVGDTLPNMRLPKSGGGEESLKDLYGQRLTVVLFWKATQPYAVEELGDLQRLVAVPFAEKQVKVVGIDVQDQPQVVEETVSAKKVEFPNLIDASGDDFAKVATNLMPRTYLVDPQGKILWFDMEYSRSTRRDLLRAIRATLSVNP